MSVPLVLLAGVLGLLVGGAVWSVAAAQAAKRPLFGGPACAACGAAFPATGWLPLLGLGTARRCPACGTRQPVRRVVFEVLVAAYFAAAAGRHGATAELVEALVFAVPLLVILLVDWWTRFIYTNVIGAGVVAGLALSLGHGLGGLASAVVAGVAAVAIFAAFFLLAIAIYRNLRVVPFGLGDVYLAGTIGTMVRWPAVVSALVLGIFLAGVTLGALLLTRRVGRRQVVPYGPFLCLGALFTLLVGR